MTYPCTKCGLCCKNLKGITELDFLHNGNGVCKFYDEIKACTIYEERPLHCRIDEGFYKLFINSGLTLQEYYKKNAEICNQLQQENQINLAFRINI